MCESTDYQLFELAKSVGSDWQELAVILGERAVDIECIQKDIPTTRERAFRMLRGWYMRCGKRASLDNVRSKIDKIRGAKQAEEKARKWRSERKLLFEYEWLCVYKAPSSLIISEMTGGSMVVRMKWIK